MSFPEYKTYQNYYRKNKYIDSSTRLPFQCECSVLCQSSIECGCSPPEKKINPRVPKLGPLPMNPERISSDLCNPTQFEYPITLPGPNYGIYVNSSWRPHLP